MGKERSGDCVRLAEADPLLTRDVPLDAAEVVRRRLVASVVEIPSGGLVPYTAATRSVLGLLILDGTSVPGTMKAAFCSLRRSEGTRLD